MLDDQDGILRALLAVLGTSTEPVGTRTARQSIQEMGYSLSESSVSRRLREMDARGWTVSVGTKGRILSPEGHRRLELSEQSGSGGAVVAQAIDVRDVQDMLQLLHARKAVESAAAADAAVHASEEDLAELAALVQKQRQALGTSDMAHRPGLDVHRKIASMSRNRMLKLLTGLLLAPHLDSVEAVLDITLGSEDDQRSVAEEHDALLDAIATRDPKRALAVMDEHFDKMIDAGEALIAQGDAEVVNRLLSLVGRRDNPFVTAL